VETYLTGAGRPCPGKVLPKKLYPSLPAVGKIETLIGKVFCKGRILPDHRAALGKEERMESPMIGIECQVCRNHFKVGEVVKAKLIEKPIPELIQEKHPKWTPNGYICLADLNLFRTRYVTEVLKSASQEVYDLEKEMPKSLEEEELLSRNINQEFEGRLTLGERSPTGWLILGEAGPSSVFLWVFWLSGWPSILGFC
jgi:hypothetical protein